MPPDIRDIPPGFPGQTLEAFAEGFLCGQVGTITVKIEDGSGTDVFGPTTANITEIDCTGAPDNSGVYRFLGTYPTDPSLSPYIIIWTGQNLAGTVVTGSEEFEVTTATPTVPSGAGPCANWIEGVDVADCCDVEYDSDTATALDLAATQASEFLFQASFRNFPGLCGPVTVRPCLSSCGCFGWAGGDHWWDWLTWADVGWVSASYLGPGTWWWGNGDQCGCGCLSKIKLSGTVQGIAQVKIDGEIVAPSEYRVDQYRYLIRKNDGLWPACQDLSLDDDQQGTWSVSYWYGVQPPDLGIAAAKQLACEFYKACAGADCALPEGVTRIIRQGVTIEKLAFSTFSIQQDRGSKKPVWRTGLPLVDAFLSAYNPQGLSRKPVFWAPSSSKRYAYRPGP